MSNITSHTAQRADIVSRRGVVRRPRRGVALMLVVGVVAVASVLSWAMLSSASMHAQLDANLVDSAQSKYLADSGVSYAMYYLRYPEKSPVALVSGAFNSHYPGQQGIRLWSDAEGLVDVTVTNPALDAFLIRSSSTVDGALQTVEAEVSLATSGYKVVNAAAFNGTIKLPNVFTITGPVKSAISVRNSAGDVLAAVGGSAVTIASSAVPTLADLALVNETGVTASTGVDDRTYTLDGVTYSAEKVPSATIGAANPLQTTNYTKNPANVWYSDTDVILNGTTFTGTLILRNSTKRLEVQGTNFLTSASSALPALIVAGELRQRPIAPLKASRLNVQGVTWVGGNITVLGTAAAVSALNFQGALLMGSAAPNIDATAGPLTVAKTAAVDNVALTKPVITGITVNRWNRVMQ